MLFFSDSVFLLLVLLICGLFFSPIYGEDDDSLSYDSDSELSEDYVIIDIEPLNEIINIKRSNKSDGLLFSLFDSIVYSDNLVQINVNKVLPPGKDGSKEQDIRARSFFAIGPDGDEDCPIDISTITNPLHPCYQKIKSSRPKSKSKPKSKHSNDFSFGSAFATGDTNPTKLLSKIPNKLLVEDILKVIEPILEEYKPPKSDKSRPGTSKTVQDKNNLLSLTIPDPVLVDPSPVLLELLSSQPKINKDLEKDNDLLTNLLNAFQAQTDNDALQVRTQNPSPLQNVVESDITQLLELLGLKNILSSTPPRSLNSNQKSSPPIDLQYAIQNAISSASPVIASLLSSTNDPLDNVYKSHSNRYYPTNQEVEPELPIYDPDSGMTPWNFLYANFYDDFYSETIDILERQLELPFYSMRPNQPQSSPSLSESLFPKSSKSKDPFTYYDPYYYGGNTWINNDRTDLKTPFVDETKPTKYILELLNIVESQPVTKYQVIDFLLYTLQKINANSLPYETLKV